MENYKKEKSSKRHLKIDVVQDKETEDIFMMANPMNYGDPTTPVSPTKQCTLPTSSSSSSRVAPPSRSQTMPTTTPTTSSPGTPTNTHSGFARTFERLSLKNRAKKIFSRSNQGGASAGGVSGGGGAGGGGGGGGGGGQGGTDGTLCKVTSMDDEESGSSGSDHEDPFSPHSSCPADIMRIDRNMSEPPKSPPSVEHYVSMPRQIKRNHSGGHSSRDSGFSSERESISHLKEERDMAHQDYQNIEGVGVSISDLEDHKEAGMESLEALQNQLQLLAKQDCDEDIDSASIYEQIISHLTKQLEEKSSSIDTMKQTETNLRLSLRLSEQKAAEAETKLVHTQERCLRVERKCIKAVNKLKSLKQKQDNADKTQKQLTPQKSSNLSSKAISLQSNHRHSLQNAINHLPPLPQNRPLRSSLQQHSPSTHRHLHPLQTTPPKSESPRIPPQRVQSQTIYDRQAMDENGAKRPSTAQGFTHDENNVSASIISLSHIETCV